MKKLIDIAKVIRSKNSSPFELTLDIILKSRQDYEKLKSEKMIDVKVIAGAYGVSVAEVKKAIYFDPAKAIKISLARSVASGSPGDSDVYGAQQHAPLLDLEFAL